MRPVDLARLVSLAAIWGSSFLFIKVALEDMNPAVLVAGRLVLGASVLLIVARWRRMRLPRDRATWRALTVMAVIGNIAPFLLIAWGEETVTSGMAAILNSTTPLFTAVIASSLIHTERLTPLRGVGVVVGFLGVAVLVGLDAGSNSVVGQIAVIVAAFSYAVSFVYAKRKLAHAGSSPVILSAAQLSVAAALFLPVGAVGLATEAPTAWTVGLLCLAALGVLGTGVAYLLYYGLIRDVGATSASFAVYLIPVFGVTLGWLVLDEVLGINTLIGSALVVAGILLAEYARSPVTPGQGGPEVTPEPAGRTR